MAIENAHDARVRIAAMVSLASLLAQWLGLSAAGPPARATVPPAPDLSPAVREYPLVARGLPAIPVAEVIAPHASWIARLQDAYGAEDSVFARDIGSVVERYAQFVHLLPATPDSHFRHAGGLFRMGLEIGFYALQASDGALLSGRATLAARANLEARWRYAAFLAGLCSELHRVLSHLTVRNEHGAEWPAYEQPLARWLQQSQSQRYHLRWVHAPVTVRALSILALTQVATPAIMQYLAQGNSVIVPNCVAAVSAVAGPHETHALAAIVQHAATVVLEQERRCDTPVDCAAHTMVTPAAEIQAATPPTPACVASPMALVAPPRLHPAVRAALRQIIDGLNAASPPDRARMMSDGVFVPLQAFAQHRVDPALAVRALGDAGMLVCDPGASQSKTCLREVDHESLLGVVLAPQWVGRTSATDAGQGVAPQ
jgi:hypothetical protein